MSADEPPTFGGEPTLEPGESAEADLASRLLGRLRRRATGRPGRAVQPRRNARPIVGPDDQAWSPPAAGERDPASLKASVDELVEVEGWGRTLDEASLAPRWPGIVGDVIAEHTRPDSLVAGELTVRASSTAWATQVRLMSRSLLSRIAAEIGDGIVVRIRVIGPTGPDWQHGPLRVRGSRGPRDTYG